MHTIYERKEIKAKKRLEILKKEEKEMGVAIMSFKQSRIAYAHNLSCFLASCLVFNALNFGRYCIIVVIWIIYDSQYNAHTEPICKQDVREVYA